ncbi:bifunctional adenosylcobinamide kinase/adenosylcobinamide-phosphate guanylyltransferase [Planococcus shenhongbingii]|uniref:Bifunctional adenosylcobinamide kinase/adenosylcobinamide-phosphate guanylyltransferase n=1 Tax=Planococcus shenhongbingii TaxID=3058398 RepID=A0ABT8NA75_9BACL|nr:bifunctional adenosylcobinamide kinase/adenosylcobinamide-phosphate guanylyltransferase [Planococcus sp. N017]MDN7244788.1 bifunctional adenosylcobinamide kinase/adenosylcobinamide-phosphate guanylyltransferase [Planococcus sp. N017]
MHIVFGGAFNGKRQYVKELLKNREYVWLERELPDQAAPFRVVAGIEEWVKAQLENGIDEKAIMDLIVQSISLQPINQQIWILTDMNRGIVPVDPLERELRDVIGRLYQQLFKKADLITRIWYGIPQTIKGADEHENLYENR